MVAQLLNSGDQQAAIRVQWRSRTLLLDLPPVSITTCLWKSSGAER
jgi:hypothetical protein